MKKHLMQAKINIKNNTLQKIFLLTIVYTIYAFLTKHLPSHNGDLDFWIRWSEYLYSNPQGSILNGVADFNYPPLITYILKFVNIFSISKKDIASNIYILKIVTLLFDFIPLIFTIFFVQYLDLKLSKILFFVFNISYLYNTMLWGQVDAIHTCFVFLSFVSVIQRWYLLAFCTIGLALIMKMQSIIFLPLLILIVILVYKKEDNNKILTAFLLSIIFIIIFFIPFIYEVGITRTFSIYTKSVGFYPIISLNAFNIWFFLSTEVYRIYDTLPIGPLTMHQWGLILFCVFSAIVLMPIIFIIYKLKASKIVLPKIEIFKLTMLSAAIITLCFFYFNTQMHERYSHPILLFFGMYFVATNTKKFFILASICYLANMEGVCKSITGQKTIHQIEQLTIIQNPTFYLHFSNENLVSFLFLILLIISFVELYKLYSTICRQYI